MREQLTLVPVRPPQGMGKTAEGAQDALQLFRILGQGYRLLSMYRCQVRDNLLTSCTAVVTWQR